MDPRGLDPRRPGRAGRFLDLRRAGFRTPGRRGPVRLPPRGLSSGGGLPLWLGSAVGHPERRHGGGGHHLRPVPADGGGLEHRRPLGRGRRPESADGDELPGRADRRRDPEPADGPEIHGHRRSGVGWIPRSGRFGPGGHRDSPGDSRRRHRPAAGGHGAGALRLRWLADGGIPGGRGAGSVSDPPQGADPRHRRGHRALPRGQRRLPAVAGGRGPGWHAHPRLRRPSTGPRRGRSPLDRRGHRRVDAGIPEPGHADRTSGLLRDGPRPGVPDLAGQSRSADRRADRGHPAPGRGGITDRVLGQLRGDPELRGLGRFPLLRPGRPLHLHLPPQARISPGFRVPLHPWSTLGFTGVCWIVVANLVRQQPLQSAIGLGILAAGLPAFGYWRRKNHA